MTTTRPAAERPSLGRLRTPRVPASSEAELTGGLRAVAVRRPSIPLVELRLAFPLAARQIANPAAPLVLSESILAGTASLDREELAAAVERLGGTLRATVAGDALVLSASSLRTRLRDLVALVADVLSGAAYPADEVRSDGARVADEVTVMLSRPEVLADEAFARRLFGAHPYAAELPRPGALVAVRAAALRRLHPSILHPGSARLVLVGDIQPARAIATVADGLGAWLEHGGSATPPLPPVPEVRSGPIELVDRPGAVQSNVRVGGNAPPRTDPEWPALALANEIFGAMFTSRLTDNLRERHGYTYSPHSSVAHRRAGSTFSISAEVGTEATAAALVETRYELGRIATTGVTDEELEAARRHAIGSFLVSTATQAGLASSLAAYSLVGLGPSYLADFPARVARATKAAVDEAARRYLSPAATATVVVGDAELVSEPLARLDEVRPT